jgi:hypothetical protein
VRVRRGLETACCTTRSCSMVGSERVQWKVASVLKLLRSEGTRCAVVVHSSGQCATTWLV